MAIFHQVLITLSGFSEMLQMTVFELKLGIKKWVQNNEIHLLLRDKYRYIVQAGLVFQND